MTWKEISPGEYRAEFGGAEKIFYRVGSLFTHLKREHYRVHCVCQLEFGSEFQGRDPVAALKTAWKTLRLELPALGVRADGPDHKVYKFLDAQGQQEWLDQSFFVEPEEKTSDEVIAREPRDLPTLHFLLSSFEIVLLCSHWRIDAIGTNWVLDRLFTLMATPPVTPPSGPTLDAVSPALEEAYGAAHDLTEEDEEYARAFIQSFRENSFPNYQMRYQGDATTPPGDPRYVTLVLDDASTATLVGACRAHEVSVTAAVHSALAQAVFVVADADDRGPSHTQDDFTCATSINLRPKLPAPYNGRAHAAQTYVMGVGCRVLRDRSFLASAKALTQQFKVGFNYDRVLRSLRAIYKLNSDATPVKQKHISEVKTNSLTQLLPVLPRPLPSGITISSLGVVNNFLTGEYGGREGAPAVKVREYHFGIDMMTRQMLMYVGTFCGKLQLSISYNRGYYDPEVPLDVLQRVQDALERGLGVKLQAHEAR
ncbi:hypothetical protein DV737_g3961, partial [Chaetothyriales sp. CBS 132003]